MSILKSIIDNKFKEVQEAKVIVPAKVLESTDLFKAQPNSLKEHLKKEDKVGIIAEIKRSSPSTGIIHNTIDIEKLSLGYAQSGASALSVLTDTKYFGGHNEDLKIARKFNNCPILRKDFIIDAYQILEAKSIGADCILLIAACVSPEQCNHLASFAKSLQLEVLLEVRSKEEIESHTNMHIDIIGVNNRNLSDFSTDITNSKKLFEHLPKELVKISESGISQASQVQELKELGYNGFLIGSYFMRHEEPWVACKTLIENYENLLK